MMNRATFIEKLTAVQHNVQQLLAQLQASEADKFVAYLYQARRQYRRVSERPNKGNKAIEREILSSYQIAQSWGLREIFARGSSYYGLRIEILALKHHILRNQLNG